jgi:methionyl-tRNA formyltransferase
VAEGVRVGLVLSPPDRPAGRRRQPAPPPAALAARELGLPLLQPERAGQAADDVVEAGVRVMAICAYGQLIGRAFLARVPWLNLHPSRLPRWRGAAPIERAIMAGDTTTAVAVMRLVAELDAGPVAAQAEFPIGPEDDFGAVSARALELGVPLLARALADEAAGRLETHEQPAEGATYAEKLTHADRLLDPEEPVAAAGARVRALSPHIGALLQLGEERVTVWSAAPAPDPLAVGEVAVAAGRLLVGFADGALELLVVQLPGRRSLPAADLLRGYRRPLGPARRA